ncbi:XdhC family protein [Algihabitans albus]|uniref:XdhC family protein n=1 Tax=Algihabitans albus TaxID=2164067 RepID=UPI000E5CF327|nr:XdhC family protein [Algihabitans albus]
MSKTASNVLTLAADLSAAGTDYCVVTVVRTANATSAKAGAKALVTGDGKLHGFVGGGCVQGAVRRTALEALTLGKPQLIRVRPKEEVVEQLDTDGVELHASSCPSGGTVDLFVEPMRQAMQVVICGASPVAATLIGLARTMGYRVTVAALTADHESLPGAARYLEGFDLTEAGLRACDAVVVATQGKRDREALAAALATPAFYVGMVGSRRKIDKLKEQLSGKGLGPSQLTRLHGPAGLDIAAIEPEEIALSILGEIVAARRNATRGSEPDTQSLT